MRKTTLACDVCGDPAQHIVQLSALSKSRKIDLCEDHHGQYVSTMTTWLGCASRQGRTQDDRSNSAEIRAWAKREGLELAEKGRIPDEIVRKYEAAHAP